MKKKLGAAIGTTSYRKEFVDALVSKWIEQVSMLSKIALYEPHAAYSAFVGCIRHKFAFYMRTLPEIKTYLEPLEEKIKLVFIPALTEGRLCTADERSLLSLPPRLGGLGIINVTKIADEEHEFSKFSSSVLTKAIVDQQRELPPNLEGDCKKSREQISQISQSYAT